MRDATVIQIDRSKTYAVQSAMRAANCMCAAQFQGAALTKALQAGDYGAAFTASESLSNWLRRGFYYQDRARGQ